LKDLFTTWKDSTGKVVKSVWGDCIGEAKKIVTLSGDGLKNGFK